MRFIDLLLIATGSLRSVLFKQEDYLFLTRCKYHYNEFMKAKCRRLRCKCAMCHQLHPGSTWNQPFQFSPVLVIWVIQLDSAFPTLWLFLLGFAAPLLWRRGGCSLAVGLAMTLPVDLGGLAVVYLRPCCKSGKQKDGWDSPIRSVFRPGGAVIWISNFELAAFEKNVANLKHLIVFYLLGKVK